jgi:hypothetical protein
MFKILVLFDLKIPLFFHAIFLVKYKKLMKKKSKKKRRNGKVNKFLFIYLISYILFI